MVGALAAPGVLLGLLAFYHLPAVRPLRVGYSEFYPYVSADEAGKPIGLAVQVVQEAAVRTGVPLQWIRVQDPETSLRSGQIDMFPLLTVTGARQRELYISAPWWEASQALLSRRDQPIKDQSGAIGKRIAIRDLNFGAAVAAQRLPGAVLLRTSDTNVMISDVCSNRVDGALLDGRLVYAALLRQPPACAGRQLQLIPLAHTALPLATVSTWAVRHTARRVYAAIEELALDGTLTELTNRWFVMPQQRYVEAKLAQQQRLRLSGFFAAAILLLVLLSVWHWRRNIRMRRAAEQARTQAQQAEQRFEAFMTHSPAIAFIKDSAGRWRYINQAFVKRFRITEEACYGKTNEELWPPAVAAGMSHHDQQVLRDGMPIQYVHQVSDPDGTCRYWLTLKFRLTDQEGNPCVGGTSIDVTHQQRAAELVSQSEERYRMLFEDAPVAIHEIDSEGAMCRVNRAGCALLGFPGDEIVGRHASEFVAPELREESVASIRAKLKGLKRLAPFERTYQRKDGAILRIEVHETAILNPSGAIRGIRSCLVDLTERYRVQARLDDYARELQEKNAALGQALSTAQEATKLKSQFLANMSHEIRTPMNGVLGLTELLLASGLSEEQNELARCVAQSGEHLLSIINDILDVSKIEAGKFELEIVPFDVPAVVEAAIELMAPSAHAKNVELTGFLAPDVPARAVGDPARLRQVLLNLIGNAVKFTSRGEICVTVACEHDDASGVVLRVTVTDTGAGIPVHAKARLFAPFMQADNSTTRKYGGTGLGLAISRRIVSLMSGEIGMESVEGQGSTFWFTCRLGRDLAAASDAGDVPLADALAGVSILIVDDHPTRRSILERYARFWGMRTESAGTGRQALLRLRARASEGDAFQLAIVDIQTDMQMSQTDAKQVPEVDGAALVRAVSADHSLAATQLVMLTSVGRVPACANVAARLPNPVKKRALFDCLCRVMHVDEAVVGRGLAGRVPARAPLAVGPAACPATPRGRVLIAEDNLVNQRVARLQVERLGFAADVVANGQEALAALTRLDYALVLMDCQMPGMDGYEATRALRLREDGARRTPVIAMTANAFASDREACLSAGMDDYLTKPVDLHSLQEILNRWASVRRAGADPVPA